MVVSRMPALHNPIARYTRLVWLGKRTLWVLAGVLTIALFVVARIKGADEHSRIILSDAGTKNGSSAGGPATMVKPRYQGIDSKNRPFSIIADRAVQPDSDTVFLVNISMDMTLENAKWVALTSESGYYHLAAKKLDLDGNIHVFFDGGYEFRTEHAEVDVSEGSAHGEKPVQGQGPVGTLQSDRFTIQQHGAIVWFVGNVNVTLYL